MEEVSCDLIVLGYGYRPWRVRESDETEERLTYCTFGKFASNGTEYRLGFHYLSANFMDDFPTRRVNIELNQTYWSLATCDLASGKYKLPERLYVWQELIEVPRKVECSGNQFYDIHTESCKDKEDFEFIFEAKRYANHLEISTLQIVQKNYGQYIYECKKIFVFKSEDEDVQAVLDSEEFWSSITCSA